MPREGGEAERLSLLGDIAGLTWLLVSPLPLLSSKFQFPNCGDRVTDAGPKGDNSRALPAAMRARLLIVLALSSCASPLADYSGYVAPRPYAIDCGAAWQYAATALKANGF